MPGLSKMCMQPSFTRQFSAKETIMNKDNKKFLLELL